MQRRRQRLRSKQAYAAKHKKAKVMDYAAQRAVNAKDYLVTEKGIDASRISTATSTDDSQKVENYLVPSGANFGADIQGTTPVDESTVKPQARKPLGAKHHDRHRPLVTTRGDECASTQGMPARDNLPRADIYPHN